MNKKNNQTPPPKVNRALYVVSVALLFVVAVIIAVMGSAGKKADQKLNNNDQTPISTDKTDTTEKIPDTYRPQTEPYTPDTDKSPETDIKTPDDSKAPVSLPVSACCPRHYPCPGDQTLRGPGAPCCLHPEAAGVASRASWGPSTSPVTQLAYLG